MPQIKPFKAIYYNKEKVGDLAKVVCPPYDVISPEEQIRYHQAHPYNFIHILLGLERPTDDRYSNKYTRAKKAFESWLAKRILVEDPKSCIYYYKQEYTIRGQKFNRLGFISLMRLHEKEDAKIFPHENTHLQAKRDRLRLWRNTKANLSPIFVCYSDKDKVVDKIFQQVILLDEPFIDIVDNDGVRHMLWRLEDADLINAIKNTVANQKLFIADGHHRYEVALQYRRFRLKKKKRSNGQEAFNFIMTYFTNIDAKDLLILPIHRVIKHIHLNEELLTQFFRIDRARGKEEMQIMLTRAGLNEHAFGLYIRGNYRLLRLKNKMLINEHINEGSREFRSLDATILKNFILDHTGVKSEDIIYCKDADQAVEMVDEGHAQACFLMNPVRVAQLKAIALNGEKMPPKTTYFYPKVLSGLTVYRLS